MASFNKSSKGPDDGKKAETEVGEEAAAQSSTNAADHSNRADPNRSPHRDDGDNNINVSRSPDPNKLLANLSKSPDPNKLLANLSRSPNSPYGSIEQFQRDNPSKSPPEDKKIEIVGKHLAIPDDHTLAAQGSSSTPVAFSTSPHKFPGSEAAHEVYKWHRHENEAQKRTRSKSLYIPPDRTLSDPSISNIRQPGGFRRYYIISKAQQEGKPPPNIISENFIDFLTMYGHFAGEYLSDDDDEDETSTLASFEEIVVGEDTPLLRESHGASASKAVFLLLKAFVGTGVMFLPKAFSNGGMIFSSLFLVAIAGISLFAFLLLARVREKIPDSFGGIGGILYGKWMRFAVLFSITISQIGFVCAYMIFVAENLQSFTENALFLTVDLKIFLLFQVLCFIPLAMIRRISKLAWTAIVADLFIMFGLMVLYFYDVKILAEEGLGKIKYFNYETYSLFIGTAVFTYEGIGLIIPITESMKRPEKFPAVLTGVMIGITLLFTSVGVLSYAAFGDSVKPVVILSLPSESPVVQGIQFLYALAILLSIPLQLFPAVRIMEQGLFPGSSGKGNPLVKWEKNVFRSLMVIVCALISWGGAQDLDKFVAFIGSFACIPLCFIYPPLFHYKVADTLRAKILDITLLLFGIITCLYTTSITLTIWGKTT